MPHLSTPLFDAAVEQLLPLMSTTGERQAELVPVLLGRPVYSRIDWQGAPRAFTSNLVVLLSHDELIAVLMRLPVGEEQRSNIESLCAQIAAERASHEDSAATTEKTEAPAKSCWPKEPLQFKHGLADRAAEWPAVSQLLTSDSQKRILIFKGGSGYSKSALLNAADLYAQALQVPTAYVDFKDTNLLTEANVLLELQSRLGSILPEFSVQNKPDRWTLRKALRKLRQPVLIFLDTYENANETNELVEWLETQLLAEVNDCEQLRFLIAGQIVPDSAGARWRERAKVIKLERIHDKDVWKAWVGDMNPNVDEKNVEGIVVGLEGLPGAISTALKICAEKL